jgi:adenosine kinase
LVWNVHRNGKKIKILPAKVKKIIDPTGAGDAWRSGFIAGLERNFDLKTSAQMGSVAASFAVEAYGTQEHTYTIEEFNNRYRHTYKNLLDL